MNFKDWTFAKIPDEIKSLLCKEFFSSKTSALNYYETIVNSKEFDLANFKILLFWFEHQFKFSKRLFKNPQTNGKNAQRLESIKKSLKLFEQNPVIGTSSSIDTFASKNKETFPNSNE